MLTLRTEGERLNVERRRHSDRVPFFSNNFLYVIDINMRHSVAPNRVSQAGSYSSSSAATVAKLLEKKKEYDAVSALERASALYLERIEALGDDCVAMANAGEGALNFLL